MILTMDEIAALPSIKLPVTLACSGNHRKEQNMVTKSVGFHWGPGAVSTSVWCGVWLADMLCRCRIKLLSSEGGSPACFVCFKGADQLPFDYYGTCIPIKHTMDKYFDVLLAYEMNGERLTPDHGFPLWLVHGNPSIDEELASLLTETEIVLHNQLKSILHCLTFLHASVDRAWMHWWLSGQMASLHCCIGE